MLSVMSADLLRRAAAKIRETATLASRELGPDWFGGRSAVENHVNLWDPSTAELVASLLDGAVVRYASLTTDDIEMRAYGLDPRQAEEALHREFALARRILGEDA